MRGQSAFEFLSGYAWVFVVLVIAGLAIAATGIADRGSYESKSCSGFDRFQYRDYGLFSKGYFVMQLHHTYPDTITITEVKVTLKDGTSESETTPFRLSSGESSEVKIFGFENLVENKRYEAEVKITFDTPGISDHTETGICLGKVETGGESWVESYTWPFSIPGNYTYDSNNVEITSGKAALIKKYSDEFEGSTLDSKWTKYNDGSGNSITVESGMVNLTTADGVARTWGATRDTSPYITQAVDGDFQIDTYSNWRNYNANYHFGGITAIDDSNDYLVVGAFYQGGALTAGFREWNNGVQNLSEVGNVAVSGSVDQPLWFRLNKTGNLWRAYVSQDGSAWTYLGIHEKSFGMLEAGLWFTDWTTTNSGSIGFDWFNFSHDYSQNAPTVATINALEPGSVTSWDSFEELATKNGGEIYYQLSSDNGSTWKYYNSGWTTAGANDYNTASVVNANIGSFTGKSLMVKAFLSSDGTQEVILDRIKITYST